VKVSLDEVYRAAALFMTSVPAIATANDLARAYARARELADYVEEQESKKETSGSWLR
jgi:hypothetical protein